MRPNTLSKIATLVAIAMGLVVALLAILGSSAVGIVAAVGALIAGALYAASGVLDKSDDQSDRE